MPTVSPVRQPAITPALLVVALVGAALLAGVLPGGTWNDTLALLASAAALFAGHERRDRDMIVAAALAAGLAPAGWLLAPLWLGSAICRARARRHLPVAALAGAMVSLMLPWPTPDAALPNLALLGSLLPATFALVVALGVGLAAWLGTRASVSPPGALFAEARLGAILLAAVLPLPSGVLGFVLILAAMPLPSPSRLRAANDNLILRRTVRLAA